MNRGCIYISEFNSEEKLRSENIVTLPEISLFTKDSKTLVRNMDQLVITMLNEGDVLITKDKLPEEYLGFWRENICEIENVVPGEFAPKASNEIDDTYGSESKNRASSGFNDLSIYERSAYDKDIRRLLTDRKIVNYALVPDYYRMCSEAGVENIEPPLSLIRKLNSKVYSNELKYKFDLPAKGIHLTSVDEYETQIHQMLAEYGKVLIKDSMGVSGKGMLLIDSEGMAERLRVHFRKQEEKGKTEFSFILEPYLKRVMDFSCLFRIDESGGIEIDGFQKNESRGYAYQGTGPLSDEEYDFIMTSGYRDTVFKIAEDMASMGYHGYACIDSMIVEDRINQVIPLVEINPRMSLSRFNLMVSRKIGKSCRLGYVEGKRLEDVNTAKIITDLDSRKLLYKKQRGVGIIPLAPGIWDKDGMTGKRVRVYYIIAFDTEDEYEEILASWFTYCSRSICAGNFNKETT